MTHQSDSLDDLTSDAYHLKTLIEIITDRAIDAIDSEKSAEDYKAEAIVISNLLWIARDLIAVIAANTEACHNKVLAEQKAVAA